MSPRILGNVTNTIVSGYSQGRLYDQVMSELPPEQSSPGTTGAERMAQAPPEVLNEIPKAEQDAIAGMDLSARHGIDRPPFRASSNCSSSSISSAPSSATCRPGLWPESPERITFDLRDGISEKIDRLR